MAALVQSKVPVDRNFLTGSIGDPDKPQGVNRMKANLGQLAGGAVIERFQEELVKAVENMCDRNTVANKKRVISIKVEMIPNAERTSCSVDIICDSKLTPNAALTTALFIGVDPRNGVIEAVEPEQGTLFPSNGINGENVVDITTRNEANES